MSFFKRDKSENGNYSSYSSTSEQWPSEEFDSKNVDYEDEDYEDEDYEYGIKFKKELSNGSLIFLIVDDDYDHAGGYVVVSPSGTPTVIKDNFDNIEDSECNHLESLAKAFFEATRK